MVAPERSLTFGLVHGSMHGAWCWDALRSELDDLGHNTVAMDLPIEDPEADLDDYAEVVIDSLKNVEDPVLVGASSGANVITRVAGLIAVNRLIYLCGSFYPSSMSAIERSSGEEVKLPEKYLSGYEDSIITLPSGLTTMYPDDAETFFYHDCSEAVANYAIGHLRMQWRSRNNAPQIEWPKVPQSSIVCRDDRVVNPEWSRVVADKLGIEITELPGGHSPFLSRPRVLAETLVKLVAA
jgi:pimeloyl-ACP methyl ester carboxylesterase